MSGAQSTHELSPGQIARWTHVGMLASLAMVLGYLETFIPIPIPGVKLGLANIAVLLALAERDIGGAFFVGAVKVAAAGLLFGNPIAMAYSATGTLLAFCVMAPLSKISSLSLVLVSMAGALAHEAGQLVVAMALLGTSLVWYSAPLLAIAGCITGFICGLVAVKALDIKGESPDAGSGESAGTEYAESGMPGSLPTVLTSSNPLVRLDPRATLIAFIVFSVAVLHFSSTPALVASLAVALTACALGRVRPRSIGRALKPTLLVVLVTFVAQVLSFQQGELLLELGPVAITAESLYRTWVMTARLLAIMGASVAVMHLVSPQGIIEAASWMLSPLRKAGMRTEGFALALNVAIAAVPTILTSFESQPWDWREWRTEVPRFIASHLT